MGLEVTEHLLSERFRSPIERAAQHFDWIAVVFHFSFTPLKERIEDLERVLQRSNVFQNLE